MKNSANDVRARIACDPRVTPFRQRVYEALLEVPRGFVTTYGLLARRIGCASAQAVGGALRENPFAPEVPCHRVVAADLTIGGFCGSRAGAPIRRKIALLKSEGVAVNATGRVTDRRAVWTWNGTKINRILTLRSSHLHGKRVYSCP